MKVINLNKEKIYSNTTFLTLLLFTLAIFLVPEAIAQPCDGPSGSCATPDFEPVLIENAVGNLFRLIEGAFGALIMVVAGLGAIVAASMGLLF